VDVNRFRDHTAALARLLFEDFYLLTMRNVETFLDAVDRNIIPVSFATDCVCLTEVIRALPNV
jgi:hypothetical protein